MTWCRLSALAASTPGCSAIVSSVAAIPDNLSSSVKLDLPYHTAPCQHISGHIISCCTTVNLSLSSADWLTCQDSPQSKKKEKKR